MSLQQLLGNLRVLPTLLARRDRLLIFPACPSPSPSFGVVKGEKDYSLLESDKSSDLSLLLLLLVRKAFES